MSDDIRTIHEPSTYPGPVVQFVQLIEADTIANPEQFSVLAEHCRHDCGRSLVEAAKNLGSPLSPTHAVNPSGDSVKRALLRNRRVRRGETRRLFHHAMIRAEPEHPFDHYGRPIQMTAPVRGRANGIAPLFNSLMWSRERSAMVSQR